MNKTLSIISSAALLFSVTFISSCKKDDDTQTFSYTAPDSEENCLYDYNLQFGSGSETFEYEISSADIQQAFAQNGVSYDPSKLNTAKLKSIKASIGNAADFEFVESIEVFVKLDGAGGNGSLIAHGENFSTSAKTVTLTTESVELKPYVIGDGVLTAKITTTKALTSSTPCITIKQGVIEAEVQK